MRAIGLVVLVYAAAAWGQNCNYSVGLGNFTGNVGPVAQTVEHTATVTRPTNSSTANCTNYRVYFGKGNANSYQRRAYSGNSSLTYNLYRTVNQGNILKDFGDALTGEFLSGAVPTPNVAGSISFFVGFPDLNSIFTQSPAGVYTDVVPINFYQVRQNGNVEYVTTRNLTISFNLPRYAELSIVPENSPHDANNTTYVMDFGTIEPSEELRADLWVKGNVGYGVMLSSMNGGQLRLSAGGTSAVPYQIRVGSGSYFTPAPAGTQFTVAQRNAGTSTAGERYNLRVRLGNFGQLEDGDYQEVITITVQAW